MSFVERSSLSRRVPYRRFHISVIYLPVALSASMSELRLTSSAPSSSFTVSGYDDSLGLQETRQFMVSLSTPTATDTTIILVTDDDG